MNVLATILTLALSAAPPQGAAPTTWSNFLGIWRVTATSTLANGVPIPPTVLEIRVVGNELTIDRRDLASGATETSRYRLDGQTARTTIGGRPVDASSAIEGTTLVIKTQSAAASGERPIVTETYTVGRNTMMMDRTVVVGGRTTTSDEVLQRVPENSTLHGGTELR